MQLCYISLLSEWLMEQKECGEGATVSEHHALSFCKLVSHAHLYRKVCNIHKKAQWCAVSAIALCGLPEDSRQLSCCLLPDRQLFVPEAIAHCFQSLQSHRLHIITTRFSAATAVIVVHTHLCACAGARRDTFGAHCQSQLWQHLRYSHPTHASVQCRCLCPMFAKAWNISQLKHSRMLHLSAWCSCLQTCQEEMQQETHKAQHVEPTSG